MKISNFKMKNSKGFTLLEMLVVIGIIAILVTLGFASYSTVQKKARNSKRQGDLKAAQQNLEQCYSVNSYQYPSATFTISGGVITVTCPGNTSLDFTIVDPLNTAPYIYTRTTTASDYTITAVLEPSPNNFIVKNQQ